MRVSCFLLVDRFSFLLTSDFWFYSHVYGWFGLVWVGLGWGSGWDCARGRGISPPVEHFPGPPFKFKSHAPREFFPGPP